MCIVNRDYYVSNINNKLLLDTKKDKCDLLTMLSISFKKQEVGLIYLAATAMVNLIVVLLETGQTLYFTLSNARRFYSYSSMG